MACSGTVLNRQSAILTLTEDHLAPQHIPMGIVLLGIHEAVKVIVYANTYCCRILGYSNEEALVQAPETILGHIPPMGNTRYGSLRHQDGGCISVVLCVQKYVIEPHTQEILVFMPRPEMM